MTIKKKDILVTIYFTQKTGLVIVATTLFPPMTTTKKIISRIKELIDDVGPLTHCLDFLSTYQVIDETISVVFFKGKTHTQFNYQRKDLTHD